jgi:hypothetical protein
MKYEQFVARKSQLGGMSGFAPTFMPSWMFDFQQSLTDWNLRKGKSATFADCGLGKTPIQLVWAENVVRHTNKPVLIVTPLAVSAQTISEASKFQIEARRSRDGVITGPCIYVTNYERLHYFDPNEFAGVVCDESSAIKNFEGKRQGMVTEFMRKMPYRLLCTATAAPNDYIELGTSAEALGELGRMDMLSQFFVNDENSMHPIWWGARWRFKQHAELAFWRWVCSWARSIRKPSDLGFDDGNFELPELIEREHVITPARIREGLLFHIPAVSLEEQREERRISINERCEMVAELANHDRPVVSWCHLNDEAALLVKLIKGSAQVSGSDSDEEKEEKFMAFSSGQLRSLVTKPKIGAFGLNWQHCSHMTTFPSHSFEQYYQAVRRCWRFGQKNKVVVDIVTTEGEAGVLKNQQRKAIAAEQLFTMIVGEMNRAIAIDRSDYHRYNKKAEAPTWL